MSNKQKLSPQGYNIGIDPTNENPFWGDATGPSGASQWSSTGEATTIPYGETPTVKITTDDNNLLKLNLGIPQGAKGNPGEQGPKGDTGPQGEQGPTGPIGPQGSVGPSGPAGPRGVQGLPGAKGEPGETGPAGPQGEQGPQGEAGPQGEPGPQGETGPAPNMNIGTVETTPSGGEAYVGITGSDGDYYLNFQLPRGEKGEPGETGPAGPQGEQGPQGEAGPQGEDGEPPTLEIGTVYTVDGLSSASITDKGNNTYALNLSLSRGARGEQGERGLQGVQGPQGLQGKEGPSGITPTLISGTTTTLDPGESATSSVTKLSDSVYQLNFGIPKGEKGDAGSGSGSGKYKLKNTTTSHVLRFSSGYIDLRWLADGFTGYTTSSCGCSLTGQSTFFNNDVHTINFSGMTLTYNQEAVYSVDFLMKKVSDKSDEKIYEGVGIIHPLIAYPDNVSQSYAPSDISAILTITTTTITLTIICGIISASGTGVTPVVLEVDTAGTSGFSLTSIYTRVVADISSGDISWG